MATRTVEVSDDNEELLRELLSQGHFESVDEIVNAGLRLMGGPGTQTDAEKIAALRRHFEASEADGAAGLLVDYTPDLLGRLDDVLAELDARARG